MTQILQRIKKAYHLETDAEVADFLDIKPSTLSMQKNRGSLDLDRILKKCDDLNKNWLLEGTGPIRKDQVGDSQAIAIYSSLAVDAEHQPDFNNSRQIGCISVDIDDESMSLSSSEELFGYLISGNGHIEILDGHDLGIFESGYRDISPGTVCLVAEDQDIICRQVVEKSDNGYLVESEDNSSQQLHVKPDQEHIQILGTLIWAIRSC